MRGARLSGVELAGLLARRLWEEGFYAARHSTSILVMREGRIVASIHVYGRGCVFRPYRPYMGVHARELALLESLLGELCESVERPW